MAKVIKSQMKGVNASVLLGNVKASAHQLTQDEKEAIAAGVHHAAVKALLLRSESVAKLERSFVDSVTGATSAFVNVYATAKDTTSPAASALDAM